MWTTFFLCFGLLLLHCTASELQVDFLNLDSSSEEFQQCRKHHRLCFTRLAAGTHRYEKAKENNVYTYLRQHTQHCDGLLERLEQRPWLDDEPLTDGQAFALFLCLEASPHPEGLLPVELAENAIQRETDEYYKEFRLQTVENRIKNYAGEFVNFTWQIIEPLFGL